MFRLIHLLSFVPSPGCVALVTRREQLMAGHVFCSCSVGHQFCYLDSCPCVRGKGRVETEECNFHMDRSWSLPRFWSSKLSRIWKRSRGCSLKWEAWNLENASKCLKCGQICSTVLECGQMCSNVLKCEPPSLNLKQCNQTWFTIPLALTKWILLKIQYAFHFETCCNFEWLELHSRSSGKFC